MCKDLYLAYNQPDVPQLSTLAQAYGEEFAAETFISAHLVKINEFVGAKNKLSDQQILDLSYQILAEYWYLNLFEFIIFCGRLRSGKYEDFYGSIDPMRILKSLDIFCADRWSDIDRAQRKEEAERKRIEEEEHSKHVVTFEQWYQGLSEEQRKEVKSNPFMSKFVAEYENSQENKK